MVDKDSDKAAVRKKPKATTKVRENGGVGLLPLARPATPQDIVECARQLGPACIETLAQVAACGTDAARVSAANALLDRGYGKAGQSLELAGPDGGTMAMELCVSPAVAAALKALGELDNS